MKTSDNMENTIVKNLSMVIVKFIGILSIAFICFIIVNKLGLNAF